MALIVSSSFGPGSRRTLSPKPVQKPGRRSTSPGRRQGADWAPNPLASSNAGRERGSRAPMAERRLESFIQAPNFYPHQGIRRLVQIWRPAPFPQRRPDRTPVIPGLKRVIPAMNTPSGPPRNSFFRERGETCRSKGNPNSIPAVQHPASILQFFYQFLFLNRD